MGYGVSGPTPATMRVLQAMESTAHSAEYLHVNADTSVTTFRKAAAELLRRGLVTRTLVGARRLGMWSVTPKGVKLRERWASGAWFGW